MSSLVGFFKDLYIKFMVWLGAEPPSGYEHFLEKKPAVQKPAARPAKPKAPSAPVTTPPKPAPPKEIDQPVAAPPEVDASPAETAPAQLVLEDTTAPAVEKKEIPAEEPAFRYEVQRGDTLSAIARRYGLTVKNVLESNNLEDPSRIYPGQKLIIPGYMLPGPELEPPPKPATRPIPAVGDQFLYTVASGDTLNAIAKRYGITLRELIEANTLEEPTKIYVGQKLVIPGIIEPPVVSLQYETDPDFPPSGPLEATRAVFMSYFAVGHQDTRSHILDILNTTEINSVVVDVKSDFGWISFPTKNALAQEIGADRPSTREFDQLMAQLKERDAYAIARIVLFKDNPLAKTHPEFAVKTDTGTIWQDTDKSGWSDPFLPAVWAYNIQLAVEAAKLGFEEIQFDFLRFPTASQTGTPNFSQNVNKDSRVASISAFLGAARGQLKRFGVSISARVLGYTCWRTDDYVIGQNLERIAEYVDVICPMLSPSTFDKGIPGYALPVEYPYEVVYHSAERAVQRLKEFDCQVRPWIQDFPDYRFDQRLFTKTEIQAQIKACFDAGATGFMAWNPNSQYTAEAYAPVTVKA